MDNKENKISTELTACKMKFMQRTVGYTRWDRRRSKDVFDKLKIKEIVDYIQNYQRKWKKHVNRINTGRIPRG